MGGDWTNKSALEILDDLKSMIAEVSTRPKPLDQCGTLGLILPLDQWERVVWYGWWPDLPPALDMWRFGLPTPSTC